MFAAIYFNCYLTQCFSLQTFITAILIYIIDHYSPQGYKALAKENMENITGDEFRMNNCIWFVSSTLLQQGAELTPMSGPGRVLGTAFWFYALILIATYTANLAAFFASKFLSSLGFRLKYMGYGLAHPSLKL